MKNFDIQFFFNSIVFIFVMTRHADFLASAGGRLQLIGFLVIVFGLNAALNLDRFSLAEAVLRATGNAAIIAACVFGLAFYNGRRRAKEDAERSSGDAGATAADRPAAPPGRAPGVRRTPRR